MPEVVCAPVRTLPAVTARRRICRTSLRYGSFRLRVLRSGKIRVYERHIEFVRQGQVQSGAQGRPLSLAQGGAPPPPEMRVDNEYQVVGMAPDRAW